MPRRIEWLHSIPALIAISLGTIYVVGAVTIYGQLKAADINAVQAMGLVPLDQILSRGIGRMASQLAQFAVAAIVLGLVLFLLGYGESAAARSGERATRRDGEDERTGDDNEHPAGSVSSSRVIRVLDGLWSNRWSKWVVIVLVAGFGLVGLPMKESLTYLLSTVILAVAFAWVWRLTERRDERGMRRIGAVYAASGLAFLLSFNIASAFLRPSPIPHIRLRTTNGVIEGGLVTESSGSWYVVEDNSSVMAVSNRRTQRVFITYPKREQERSLVDVVLHRPPSTMFGQPWKE
jgi:hypothetical protein